MKRSLMCLPVLLASLLPSVGAAADSGPDVGILVEARVPQPPAPVPAQGSKYLLYEIYFTNHMPMTATLMNVEARRDDAEGAVLVSYEGDELAGNLYLIGHREAAAGERSLIPAGGSAIAYVLIKVPAADAAPTRLHHRAAFTIDAGNGVRTGWIDFDTPVLPPSEVIAVSPPLAGGPWVAANGLSNTAGHRRTALPLDGRAGIAQRYAIDYAIWGENLKTYDGDPLDNTSYYAYGREVLAVADAVVTHIHDGVPENVPGEDSRAIQITIESAPGNSVILDLGGGRYAFYAHLIPGSLEVEVGDRVRRGQVLARLGNSGNSTEPHLHFHIGDRNSPLASEGLPYVYYSFTLLGACDMEAADPADACTMGGGELRYGELPINGDLVRFPETPSP